MDDIDLLRNLRSDLAPTTPTNLVRARSELLREMHRTRAGSSRFAERISLGGWRFVVPAGLALVLAAGLFVTVSAGGPQDSPAAQNPGAGGDAVAGASTADSEAERILRNAALTAEHEPLLAARPNQYVFVESITDYHTGETFDCDGKADQSDCKALREPKDRRLRQIWLSVDGTRDGLLRERPQSGPGGSEEVPLTICRPTSPALGVDGKPASPACFPQPAYRADLPADGDSMLAYLQQDQQGGATPEASKPSPGAGEAMRAGQLIHRAGDLMRETYLPPASLAALFEAVAKIPGTTVRHDAVDAAGRQGVSVGVDYRGIRNEWIFDPITHAYLGSRTIALEDTDTLKKGTVDGQAAQMRVAIVDKLGQLPQTVQ